MGESHIRSVLLRIVIASVQTYKKYSLDIRAKIEVFNLIIGLRYMYNLSHRTKNLGRYSQPPLTTPTLHFLSIEDTATGPMMVLTTIAQIAIKNASSSSKGVGV